jgi:NarL family two-component system response regulator LiaR
MTANEPRVSHPRMPRLQEAGLSPRERHVAELIAQGLTNQAIATRMSLSTSTVKSYVSGALRRLDLNNRSQLALWAIRHPERPEGDA